MKHLVENTPRHTGIILDKLSNDQLTIRLAVDNLDEAIKGLNRAANRLSLSMVLASLVIGGGLIMQSLKRFKKT